MKAKYAEARDSFSAAASTGNTEAMLRLAGIYENGVTGIPADRAKAESYFRAAATGGNEDAMRFLGDLLCGRDRGALQWSAEAEKWYLNAVKANSADKLAMLGLAELYGFANRNPANARKWYNEVLKVDHHNAEAIAWMMNHEPIAAVDNPPGPAKSSTRPSGVLPP